MEILKKKVSEIVSLKKLDICMAKEASLTCEPGKFNDGRLVLAVDSSMITVGFILYQVFRSNDTDLNSALNSTTKLARWPGLVKFPICYGSITLNSMESNYGQPKIELFGLFQALKALEHLVWGFNVLVEMDASLLKAMANSPGLPNAAATQWISYIQLFDLEFKHVSAENHKAPDGLLRCMHAAEDTDNTDPGEDCDHYGPFITSVQPLNVITPPLEAAIQLAEKGIADADTVHIIAAMTWTGAEHSGEWPENDGQLKGKAELEELQLHPHHVLDEEKEEYWKNISRPSKYLKQSKIRSLSSRQSESTSSMKMPYGEEQKIHPNE
jgi:hypothetical protein